ncbi:hypothetical protein DNTS_005295 [Danionella cerebrum]|uniref:Uncharacterized protein n=1 Tax=Danionella cerebrum TaxID=2873325 RepID=A0A553R8W6_9TELE|nr:hypothetical protein DNTS_005295 [Danionella translucida]
MLPSIAGGNTGFYCPLQTLSFQCSSAGADLHTEHCTGKELQEKQGFSWRQTSTTAHTTLHVCCRLRGRYPHHLVPGGRRWRSTGSLRRSACDIKLRERREQLSFISAPHHERHLQSSEPDKSQGWSRASIFPDYTWSTRLPAANLGTLSTAWRSFR